MGSSPVFDGVHVGHLFSFQCCIFALFIIVLCHVCPMFLVSLDCLVVIAPSVFANVYLSLSNQIITLMPQMKTNV